MCTCVSGSTLDGFTSMLQFLANERSATPAPRRRHQRSITPWAPVNKASPFKWNKSRPLLLSFPLLFPPPSLPSGIRPSDPNTCAKYATKDSNPVTTSKGTPTIITEKTPALSLRKVYCVFELLCGLFVLSYHRMRVCLLTVFGIPVCSGPASLKFCFLYQWHLISIFFLISVPHLCFVCQAILVFSQSQTSHGRLP